MTSRKLTIAVAIWALAILVFLGFASVSQIKSFDPENILGQAASQPEFDSLFAGELAQAGISPGTLVHIQSANRCYCNQLTETHREELAVELQEEGFQLAQLSLNEHPAISQFVGHFPALAVVDNNGQLRYLGPYAMGYGCFTGKNLVAKITQLATSAEYYGAQVNSEVKGCFCKA